MRWRDGYSWIALAALLLVAAAFFWHETRGTTLWFDEWEWALYRRGDELGTFLEPHNEHLSLVPIAVYRLLFATAGLTDYAPFRALVIGGHLACVVLVYVYASRRVGGPAALLAAVPILFLGPAWQNFLWPFQIGWLISIAAGVGALLALDRGDRRGGAAACALLALALASSGLGIPIAAGVAVELLWARRRPRDAWIVVAPLAVYALWWVVYQQSDFARQGVVLAPGFAADSAAAALSALAGLAGSTIAAEGETLGWGRPLAVLAAGVLVWRLAAQRPVAPRVLALLAILLSFWLLTGLRRAGISSPDEGRYLYVGGLFLVLLAVELARGVALQRWAGALLACAVALSVVANVGDVRDGGRYLRSQAPSARAELAALELARPLVQPDYVVSGFPGHPLIRVRAGAYFDAAGAYGSPAASAGELAAAPEGARLLADAELARIHAAALAPVASGRPGGAAPALDSASGGRTSADGACVRFRPAGARAAGVGSELAFTLPTAGVLLRARGGPATVALRRFADGFPAQPLGTIGAGGSATLRIEPDLADRPWHVRVASERPVAACGVA